MEGCEGGGVEKGAEDFVAVDDHVFGCSELDDLRESGGGDSGARWVAGVAVVKLW